MEGGSVLRHLSANVYATLYAYIIHTLHQSSRNTSIYISPYRDEIRDYKKNALCYTSTAFLEKFRLQRNYKKVYHNLVSDSHIVSPMQIIYFTMLVALWIHRKTAYMPVPYHTLSVDKLRFILDDSDDTIKLYHTNAQSQFLLYEAKTRIHRYMLEMLYQSIYAEIHDVIFRQLFNRDFQDISIHACIHERFLGYPGISFYVHKLYTQFCTLVRDISPGCIRMHIALSIAHTKGVV